jgi:hypothetical protein
MEYIVMAPPVITPSEPPSGAFLLAAGMRARGIDAGFLDLSLEFFKYVFDSSPRGRGHPDTGAAVDYLRNSRSYTIQGHSTACGILNSRLKAFSSNYPGWRITLMDSVPPVPVHSPEMIRKLCIEGGTPFSGFLQETLPTVIRTHRPGKVLLSVSYLSQLPAAIETAMMLKRMGQDVVAGGSLFNSLSRTGEGFRLIKASFENIMMGDGSSLTREKDEPMLSSLTWPEMICEWDYISGRPVIPFALSTGCYWDRCLFCPDAGRPHQLFGRKVLSGYLESVPSRIMRGKPVIHFLDSAVSKSSLDDAMPVLREKDLSFYTFARPEPWLGSMTQELAENGCLMLQLGIESGSHRLLQRFCKGIRPDVSLQVLKRATAAGIRSYAYMLLGLPGETEEDVTASLRLLEAAGSSVDFINFSIFNLPENCELTKRASEFGIQLLDDGLPEDRIRLYRPFLSDDENPRIDAREAIASRFPRITSVKEAMRRTPKWFRTSHFPLIEIEGRHN